MFTTEEEMLTYFVKWLKKMGYNQRILISACYGKKLHGGRVVWDLDVQHPHGVFLVFDDDKSVMDQWGVFGNGVSQIYNSEGVKI